VEAFWVMGLLFLAMLPFLLLLRYRPHVSPPPHPKTQREILVRVKLRDQTAQQDEEENLLAIHG